MRQTSNPKSSIYITVFLSCLLLLSLYFFYSLYSSRPKIAFVRSTELIYNYNGMKQAHAEFTRYTAELQANVDTLKVRLNKGQADLQSGGLSLTERAAKEAELERMKKEFMNYTSVIQQQAKEKEQSMTQAVLNQINSYVEAYAKKGGYDIVLGSEGSGSIIYGRDAFDITSEVLSAMNRDYKVLPESKNAVSAN